jgi:hypothetical protein
MSQKLWNGQSTTDASVFDETEVLRMWIFLLVSENFCIEITITSYVYFLGV